MMFARDFISGVGEPESQVAILISMFWPNQISIRQEKKNQKLLQLFNF